MLVKLYIFGKSGTPDMSLSHRGLNRMSNVKTTEDETYYNVPSLYCRQKRLGDLTFQETMSSDCLYRISVHQLLNIVLYKILSKRHLSLTQRGRDVLGLYISQGTEVSTVHDVLSCYMVSGKSVTCKYEQCSNSVYRHLVEHDFLYFLCCLKVGYLHLSHKSFHQKALSSRVPTIFGRDYHLRNQR